MTEISGVSFQKNNGNPVKGSSVKKQFEEFKQSAFDSYNKFKEKAEAEFNDFRQQNSVGYKEALDAVKANDEYAKALEDSANWKKFECTEGIKRPVFDKPKTAPVYVPEKTEVKSNPAVSAPVTGPKEGENPEYDKIVKGQEFIQSSEPSDEMVKTGPKEGQNPEYDAAVSGKGLSEPDATEMPQEKKIEDKPKLDEKLKVQPKVESVKVNAEGVAGSYSISKSKNGKGFSLKMDMYVSILQNKNIVDVFLRNRNLTQDDDGNYSFRGIKSKNYNHLSRKITNMAQQVMMRQAIYNDLMAKKNAGTELTQPEQSFVKSYLYVIDKLGLKQDSNGQLIDKSII